MCIEGRPLCQFGGASPNQTIGKWKAVDENADIGTAKTKDPASYAQLGAYLFQYAARYGKTEVADAKLTLASGQARFSGAGVLEGIEIRNEANGPWQGRRGFMTPVEQAALALPAIAVARQVSPRPAHYADCPLSASPAERTHFSVAEVPLPLRASRSPSSA